MQVGKLTLEHRVVLAPLTRFRADDDHVPQDMAVEYYRQRASVPGTLLVSEGTYIHHRAGGMRNVPGIWSTEQVEAWKKVTAAVHAEGSFIYCQLWALGRAAPAPACHPDETGEPVSASDMPLPLPAGGDGLRERPHALTPAEIDDYVGWYVAAARNAVAAGFDGVELHGANGYLLDQFTQDVSNTRSDAYGGSVENRSRFGLRVAGAVAEAIGPDRVGYRLSPWSTFQAMRMRDPRPQFEHLIRGLGALGIAYVHLVEARIAGSADVNADRDEALDWALEAWGRERPAIVAGGLTPKTAVEKIDGELAGFNVAIGFGRSFISNPDLPYRIKEGLELEPYDRSKFYTRKSANGYTDYPFHPSFNVSKAKI